MTSENCHITRTEDETQCYRSWKFLIRSSICWRHCALQLRGLPCLPLLVTVKMNCYVVCAPRVESVLLEYGLEDPETPSYEKRRVCHTTLCQWWEHHVSFQVFNTLIYKVLTVLYKREAVMSDTLFLNTIIHQSNATSWHPQYQNAISSS